jgi:hypothetical protein
VVRDLPWTEAKLRELLPFEFENWAVIALGGIPNKTQVGDMGIGWPHLPRLRAGEPPQGEAEGPCGETFDAFKVLFYGRAANPGATPPVTAIVSLRDLKKAQSDAATIDRREAGRVNKLLALIEKDCQDWYAEATRFFSAGTEIGDLIRSEVPTTSDYNPPTPATPPAGGGGGGTPP